MNQLSGEEIEAAKAALPVAIRNFLESSEYKKLLFDTGHEFGLNLRGVAELTDIVTMTVLGLRPQQSFPTYIANTLTSLDKDTQHKLINVVDRKIFSEIQKRIHAPQEAEPDV
jgi:hypothetical protein